MVSSPVPQAQGIPIPAATGGEALPTALASLQNLRTIRQGVWSRALNLNAENVAVLPDIGYSKAYRIFFKGTLTNTPGTGTIVAGDPRKLIRSLGYMVMTSTRIHELGGVEEQLLNNLDFKVIPSKQTFSVATGAQAFFLELVIFLPFSERKLAGLIYKGGGSTYSTIRCVLGSELDILTLTGNATATFGTTLTWDIREERIDREAPQNPRRVVTVVNGKEQETIIPGRGLWQETSRFIETVVDREELISGVGRDIDLDMQVAQPHLRVILVNYLNGQVDSGDTMISNVSTMFENTTTQWDFSLDEMDREYRELFKKNRPGGVWVISFRDKTDTDRDTLYTRDLGRFVIRLRTAATAPGSVSPTTFCRVVVQRVRYLQEAARY